MAFSDWSTNPANNGIVSGVTYWPEGMLPGQVNDTGRQMMADLATWLANPSFPSGAGNLLGYPVVQQGTGVGQLSNVVKMGWDGTRVRVTIDATDQGPLITDVLLANGSRAVNGAAMSRNGATLYGTDNFNPATKQDLLGFTPVQQGGGSGMTNNKVYLGWSGTKPLIQIDATPAGGLALDASSRARCNITDGTAAPSGGMDGDIYFQYS